MIVLAFMLSGSVLSCAAQVSEKSAAQARIQYDLGIASFNQGDMRGALRELLQTVRLDPTLVVARNALGLVYHAMGRYEDAVIHYKEAVRLKPDFSEVYNNLGAVLTEMGRYDDAIAAFEQALSNILYLTPYLAEGNMGWALYKKGSVDEGMLHLRNAISANPRFCRGYTWLAEIGVQLEKPEQVLANGKRFEKYCINDKTVATSVPDSYIKQMHYFMGVSHLKQGDQQAAREAFSKCASDDMDAGTYATQCFESLRALY